MTLAQHLYDLFQGREDVYARSKGKGFAPEHEALTVEAIRDEHLAGECCLGFYLMRPDSHVRCACVDFDNKAADPDPEWWDKAIAVKRALASRGITALLEISQSGNAAHVWVFLGEWVPAREVRAFLADVSSECGFPFREIYPRQDQLKEGGIGNLVRLPLWNKSRFVDEDQETIDPLEALSGIVRVPTDKLTIVKSEKKSDAPTIEGLSDRVSKLVTTPGTPIARRWAGDVNGLRDTSRSSLALAICALFVKELIPTDEIKAALRRWCRVIGYDKGERDDWIDRTVAKAYESAKPKAKQQRRDDAYRIVELATDSISLCRADDDECYCTFPFRGHKETTLVDDERFEHYLRTLFSASEKRVASAESLKNARQELKARAQEDAPLRPVFTRVGHHEGKIYLDLDNHDRQIVEVDKTGWRVRTDAPILFRRPRHMLPLPVPVKDGSVDALRPFVNVRDEDWPLFLGGMVMIFHPYGPFPLMLFMGRPGCAKTSTAKLILWHTDPSLVVGCAEPRKVEDLMIAAGNRRVVWFDNLSALDPQLSDALCRLSTGAAFTRRTLYRNADETLFIAKRPVIITSVNDVALAPDLLDRSIRFELSPITQRMTEVEFESEIERIRPQVLGALLDGVVASLRSNVKLANPPRMAEFASFATGAEAGLGMPAGAFMASYTRNMDTVNDLILDGDLAAGILQLVERPQGFEGTASELAQQLSRGTSPTEARRLSAELRSIEPALEARGISVERFRSSGHKQIRISRHDGYTLGA